MNISDKNYNWWFVISCVLVAMLFVLSMSLAVNDVIMMLFVAALINLLICIYVGT